MKGSNRELAKRSTNRDSTKSIVTSSRLFFRKGTKRKFKKKHKTLKEVISSKNLDRECKSSINLPTSFVTLILDNRNKKLKKIEQEKVENFNQFSHLFMKSKSLDNLNQKIAYNKTLFLPTDKINPMKVYGRSEDYFK